MTYRTLTTHTGATIRAPEQLSTLGKPFVRAAMTGHREYIEPVAFTRPPLSRRASLTNPRDAHNSTTPASEAGWGTESGNV